jgi:IS30 family transposase
MPAPREIDPPTMSRGGSAIRERVACCGPWQRGSNENTNGLLRQYLPKTADLSRFSQSELDEIALRLNTRPRQTLGFRTPADKLQVSVASTP